MPTDDDPKGPRGRLSRSGRFLPLVKPATIAPPIGEFDEEDDYAEVSIERGAVEETPIPVMTPVADDDPAPDADDDPDADALTPPR